VLALPLAIVIAGVIVGFEVGYRADVLLVAGLDLFGVVFAINSSVHSYLILAYFDLVAVIVVDAPACAAPCSTGASRHGSAPATSPAAMSRVAEGTTDVARAFSGSRRLRAMPV
jgi:hypothetical protein